MSIKKCSICNLRSVGTGKGSDPEHARTMGYCAPCLEEAEWENEHSDRGHDDADFEGDSACWICHPELNEAQKAHTPRKGHSNGIAKTYSSHKGCNHQSNPAARARCRKAGGPKAPTAE